MDAPPRRRRPRCLRCRNLRKKRRLQKPRRWRRSRWAAASLRRSLGRPTAKFPSSLPAWVPGSLMRARLELLAQRCLVRRLANCEIREPARATERWRRRPKRKGRRSGRPGRGRERRGKKAEKGILKRPLRWRAAFATSEPSIRPCRGQSRPFHFFGRCLKTPLLFKVAVTLSLFSHRLQLFVRNSICSDGRSFCRSPLPLLT